MFYVINIYSLARCWAIFLCKFWAGGQKRKEISRYNDTSCNSNNRIKKSVGRAGKGKERVYHNNSNITNKIIK